MKKYLIIIIAIFLIGCQKDTITMNTYGENLYALVDDFNLQLEDGIYENVYKMMTYDDFNAIYSHENLIHEMNQMIVLIDDILIRLNELGLSFDHSVLLKQQSDLEYALKDYQNILQDFVDDKTNNSITINQFTLYRNYFNYLVDSKEVVHTINRICTNLETSLLDEGVSANDDYYLRRIKNQKRWIYQYAIMASQVSVYKEYTGLHVSPDKHHIESSNMVLEISPYVFQPVMTCLVEEMKINTAYENLFLDDDIVMKPTDLFLMKFMNRYETYEELRSHLPLDFFTSGDYKDYQVFYTDGRISRYQFDYDQYPEMKFEEMLEVYIKLTYAIRLQSHLNFMAY